MKTKEQIAKYNKEYSARPEVKKWAAIRNARPERKAVRKAYKQTEASKRANYKYRTKPEVKERVRRRRLEKRYGVTHDQVEKMREEQGHKCKICGTLTELHIDHSHSTGKVRGLLCGKCNMAIGLFKDDTNLLMKAINYLHTHGI